MSSINKIHLYKTGATYDISPSPDGTLDTTRYTSNDEDQADAVSYISVNKIENTDTNATIFSKITSMMQNLRYIYNMIGTDDISEVGTSITNAINELETQLANKANSGHTHSVSDLPVSNIQINSTDYIPSSALVYSMDTNLNTRITNAENRQIFPSASFTTNVACGALTSDTFIDQTSSIADILTRMLRKGPDSTKYQSVKIDTWNSTSDVDAFFTAHNAANNWSGLKLGNYITINDGTYNNDWVIAGFDCEHNQLAADGTTYDNGTGICLIPKDILRLDMGSEYIPEGKCWDYEHMSGSEGYRYSDINAQLNGIALNFQSLLGTHLIERDVLLSNGTSGTASSGITDASSSYTWTTAYLTLMSIGQMTNNFGDHWNQYDDGEAYYYLPLFEHEDYKITNIAELIGEEPDIEPFLWTRNIKGTVSNSHRIWSINPVDGSISDNDCGSRLLLRPLMYLR